MSHATTERLTIYIFGALVLLAVIGGGYILMTDGAVDTSPEPAPDGDMTPDPEAPPADDDTDSGVTSPEDLDGPMKPGAMVYFDNLLGTMGVDTTYVNVDSTTAPCPDIIVTYHSTATIEPNAENDAKRVALAYADLTNTHPDGEYTDGDVMATGTHPDPDNSATVTYQIDNADAEQYIAGDIDRQTYLDRVYDSIEVDQPN